MAPETKDSDEGIVRGPERALRCPKCSNVMQKVQAGAVEVDRCVDCGGIWFDLLEHEDLKKDPAAARKADAGAKARGKDLDKLSKVPCPVCKVKMLQLVTPLDREVRYEKCPQCSGVFFDAGELTEFLPSTFTDKVLSAVLPGRGKRR